MAFQSVESLLLAARDAPVWQVVLEDDCRDRGSEREESWARMAGLWSAMQSAAADYDPARRSPSGLSGGNAARLEGPGPGLCGPFVREIIAAAPGCKLVDDLANKVYPMPLDTSDQDIVFVGRIRPDLTDENGLNLWCCGDQVRKGAATNAVQIAELVIKE